MKVTKKTKNVSSNITLDDYDRLMKIARREGKATPKLLRIAIDKLFQKYTVWDTLQKLLTSENTGNIPLPVIEALILAVQKGFETTEKKYREAEQRNPKLKKLTKKTLDGLGNTKPKTERVSGSLNKESNQTRSNMKEIGETFEKENLDYNKLKSLEEKLAYLDAAVTMKEKEEI